MGNSDPNHTFWIACSLLSFFSFFTDLQAPFPGQAPGWRQQQQGLAAKAPLHPPRGPGPPVLALRPPLLLRMLGLDQAPEPVLSVLTVLLTYYLLTSFTSLAVVLVI